MGLVAPTVNASALWPEAGEPAPANTCLWLRLQLLGGAFAELELFADGASLPFTVSQRAAPHTPPHPGVPMPPGWTPQPGPGLYAIYPGAPLPPGASCLLTVRRLEGHEAPPLSGAERSACRGPYSVRPATHPPQHVQRRSEPVLELPFSVAPARPHGEGQLRVEADVRGGPSSPPGPPVPAGPPGQVPLPLHTLIVETSDAPVFVCWDSAPTRGEIVRATGEHRVAHDGAPSSVRARLWSWTGELLTQLQP